MRLLKGSWFGAIGLVVMLSLQSCLKNDNNMYDAYKFLADDISTIQEYIKTNNIDAQMDSATGVFYQIHKKGDGYKTFSGIEVEANYQGTTLDGDEFVNTYSGLPERITLGPSSSNPVTYTGGLSIGLLNMHAGDSATIYVPSPYGFQDQGYAGVPPNTIIVYHVKFEDILLLNSDISKIDQYIADKSWTASVDSVYGTRYIIHKPGDPEVMPKDGYSVILDYQGEFLDGTVFDSSFGTGNKLTVTMGANSVITGFELGLSQLHKSDSATIFLPSIYAYGKSGASGGGATIPPNTILLFGVKIDDIVKPF